MINTVKKRLIFLTVSLLIVFCFLALTIAIHSFFTNRQNRIVNMDAQVTNFGDKIHHSYAMEHDILKEFSSIASLFYATGSKDKEILKKITLENFRKRLPEAGVGIWFEPYIINPEKKWYCLFAYLKDRKIMFNDALENSDYDYLNKDFYTQIKQKSLNGNKNIYTPTWCSATGHKILALTIGDGIYHDGKNIGIITVDWELDTVIKNISLFKPTPGSFSLFADKDNDFIIALTNAKTDVVGSSLKTLKWYKNNLQTGSIIKINNRFYITFPKILDNGLLFIVNVPVSELFGDLYANILLFILLAFSGVILITAIIYNVLTKNVNKPIDYLVKTAEKIGSGALDTKMEISEPLEFAQLAGAFNKMTDDVKNYMSNLNEVKLENERIESELAIAKTIQLSALPSSFPPYPERKEFDIYADMVTAYEVGGDFYDFFFIDDDNFAFLIADVSGKGIPAALFMMEAKAILKDMLKTGIRAADAMTIANDKIYKNNKQGFFVTIYLAVINLKTGNIKFVSAGHNPPLIKRANGNFEYYRSETNFVFGVMENFQYICVENTLSPGDEIFFYTDGVTEAMDINGNQYGTKRLEDVLNSNKDKDIKDLIPIVKNDITNFTKDAEQSDDITTIIFRYNGNIS